MGGRDPCTAGGAGPDERQTSCELLLFCLMEFQMRALLSGECSTIKTTFLLHVGTFPALTCFQNRCEFFARAPAPLLQEQKMSSLLMCVQTQKAQRNSKMPFPSRSGALSYPKPQLFPQVSKTGTKRSHKEGEWDNSSPDGPGLSLLLVHGPRHSQSSLLSPMQLHKFWGFW